MLTSCIKNEGKKPRLYIDGKLTPAMAYTTYFEERSCYKDFVEMGYRIFFVNLSFTKKPINNMTGFTPFRIGAFEDPDNPDYSEFENAVERILKKCPDAIIFPRIYVSMPSRWTKDHTNDVILASRGGYREILFSKAFREDAEKMLVSTVRHIKKANYSDRIGGWQICGGNTQEWFHHDMQGSLCPSAETPFREWVSEIYGDNEAVLPNTDDFQYHGISVQRSESARRYSEFCNAEVAKTLDILAAAIKRETEGKQVVGAFYGYSLESNYTVLFGTHAIYNLLDSKNLDFFSSPNAYTDNRAFGIDWGDMMPVGSLKLHEKLCFIECDIRTHLTAAVQEARPGEYPDDIYRTEDGKSVWAGPPTKELSVKALRKCFAHQITNASAIWWFDMWGGWYDDPVLLSELKHMNNLYSVELTNEDTGPARDVVLFTDERGYANLYSNSPELGGIYETRKAMGNIGTPYDIFAVEDAEKILGDYKAAIFPFPAPSKAGREAIRLCKKMGIPYLSASSEKSGFNENEINTFLKENGIHLYSKTNDVVYIGNGYIGLHTLKGGTKTLYLPKHANVSIIFGTDQVDNAENRLIFELQDNGTALFSIKFTN